MHCLMFCFWFVFRCKDIALFYNNKIKTELYFLICKILLEQVDLVMNAIFFCVARKIFLPRHPVIFSMQCACRECKRNLDASSMDIDHVNLPLCSYFAF